MLRRLAAVVLLFPSKVLLQTRTLSILIAWLCLFQPIPSLAAQGFSPVDRDVPEFSPIPSGYLARIELDSPEDVEKALERAEQLFLTGQVEKGDEPLAFVLHGPEVAIFFRDNYKRYKKIVDLAARLAAFEVVEVSVCETQMGVLGREKEALVPFVGTVPFGPAEIDRLLTEKQYIYF